VLGRGTATPATASLRQWLLLLWTLPYGVVKAALAAGEKTTVVTEGGVTVITFPLSGPLADVTVRGTLDSNSLETKVETRPDNPALAALATQTEYSNYTDRADVLTDIETPGRIVRKQGTRTVLDLEVKMWETNNPYLVFPVPANVKAAAPPTPADLRLFPHDTPRARRDRRLAAAHVHRVPDGTTRRDAVAATRTHVASRTRRLAGPESGRAAGIPACVGRLRTPGTLVPLVLFRSRRE
jgi:hypothetical protein